MNTKEEFNAIVNQIKEKLDETNGAMISEEILATIGAYNTAFDSYETLKAENETLKEEKEELLKVNGRLFQKIGFEDEESKKEESSKNEEEENLTIEDVVNEKGELI